MKLQVVAFIAFAVICPCAQAGVVLPARSEPYVIDSGNCDNLSGQPVTVFTHTTHLKPTIPWVRVIFSVISLPPSSFVRLTALQDGATQTLDAAQLRQWGNGTAFFNGREVTVELVAAPHSSGNRIRVNRLIVGDPSKDSVGVVPDGICGESDDRVPSADPRIGRLLPGDVPEGPTPPDTEGGGTAFLIDACAGTDKLQLATGHSFHRTTPPLDWNQNLPDHWVLQFHVPDSLTNCAIMHPSPTYQFPLDRASFISLDEGLGKDWAVFRCNLSSPVPPAIPQTTFQAEGFTFPIVPPPATVPHDVRVTGYGRDGNENSNCLEPAQCCPTGTSTCFDGICCGCKACACGNVPSCTGKGRFHYIQQTATGPRVASPNNLATLVDSCSGNSGSPVIIDQPDPGVVAGSAIGILFGGNCDSEPNDATRTTAPELTAAINYLVDPGSNGAVAAGGRYLRITPGCGSTAQVALRVRGNVSDVTVDCLDHYVQADGRLALTPVFRPQNEWRTVHVFGCEIAPSSSTTPRQYTVEKVPQMGSATALGSPSTWIWGDTFHTGTMDLVDVDDVLCELDAFAGIFDDRCTLHGADLRGPDATCIPDAVADVDDLLAVLDAVSGAPYPCSNPCSPPCAGGMAALGLGGGNKPGPGPLPAITLEVATPTFAGERRVSVHVLVSGVESLRGGQVTLEAVGGQRGGLVVEGIARDRTRKDFVFHGLEFYEAVDVRGGRMEVCLRQGGAPAIEPRYMTTLTFVPTADALGTFQIEVRDVQLRDPAAQPISVEPGAGIAVPIGVAPKP